MDTFDPRFSGAPRPLGMLDTFADIDYTPTSTAFLDDLLAGQGSTLNLSRKQRGAERAARTETRKLERAFGQMGRTEDWESYYKQGGDTGVAGFLNYTMDNLVDPAFDLLQIGQFTTVGLVQELLRTGSTWEALKQAGVEFANALPGIELEGAKRPSWGHVLAGEGKSGWGAAAAGFVLDVVLDPINLIPGGAIAKAARTAGAKGLKASGRVGESFARKFLAQHVLKENVPSFMKHLTKYQARLANVPFEVERWTDEVMGGLLPEERIIVGAYLDSGRFRSTVSHAVTAGIIAPERKDAVIALGEYLWQHSKDIADESTKLGFFDQSMFRKFYNAHFDAPVGSAQHRAQKRIIEKIAEERGGTTVRRGRALSMSTEQGLNPGKLPAAKPRTYPTTVDRVQAMLGGELDRTINLDIKSTQFQRTAMHEKWKAFHQFLDGVLTDETIAERIALPGDIFNDEKLWQVRKLEMEGTRPGYAMLEVKRTTAGGEKTIGAYWVPQPVHDVVTRAEKAYSAPDDVGEFFNFINRITNVWKGWATFGTGYIFRNLISSANQNWLHGVGSSWKPGDVVSGKFPFPGKSFGMRYLQGMKVQMYSNRAGSLPKGMRRGVERLMEYADVQAWPDIPLPKVMDENGKLIQAWEELARLGEDWGVPVTATRVYDLPPDVERKMWEGMSETIPTETLRVQHAAGEIDDTMYAALTMGRNEGMTAGQWFDRTFGTSSPVVVANRVGAQITDNQARWAMFIDDMEKGASPYEAAMATKTWHFDYNNLTTFEKKWLRTMIPFYSWTRFNLPRQLMAMMENPSHYAKMPKLQQAIENLSPEWKGLPTPDYFNEVQAIQSGLMHNDRPMFVQLDLPVMDLNRLSPKDIASTLHPFFKAFEYLPQGGYSFFKEAPIEAFPGQASEGLPFMSKLTEAKLEAVMPAFGRYVSRPARAAARGTLDEQLMSELTGIRLRSLDVRRVTRAQTFRKRRLARDFMRRLQQDRDIGL